MVRTCGRCGKELAEGQLDRDRTGRMEADRAAAGLAGVRFGYYCCPCGADDVFIDVFPVSGEAPGTLGRRLAAMNEAARRVRVDGVETRVQLLGRPPTEWTIHGAIRLSSSWIAIRCPGEVAVLFRSWSRDRFAPVGSISLSPGWNLEMSSTTAARRAPYPGNPMWEP
jgi:hypothetical protein